MITSDPLKRIMVEKDLNLTTLSQITGIDTNTLGGMMKGRHISERTVGEICRVLQIQPSEVIEFTKDTRKGHWEWIENAHS